MERDEILRRGRNGMAEEEAEFIKTRARRVGEIGLCVFFLILWIYKALKGLPAQDLLALFWGYLGFGYISAYRHQRDKKSLISAVCGMIAAVAFALGYLLQTW